jgi:hypothetical protein
LEDRLAELHAEALGETEEQIAAAAAAFMQRWDRDFGSHRRLDARMTARAVGARESEVAAISGGARLHRYLVLGAAAAAVAAIAVTARRSVEPEAPVGSDRRPARALPAGALELAVPDPCQSPVRALGTDPLLDDFEDGNEGLYQTESRNGYWVLFEDVGRDGHGPFLKPEARPGATERNRLALHASGGTLHDWGASLQVRFGPACYDVSAYRGVAFSALGPGRLRMAVGEVRVIPVEWGGTCTHDCYDLCTRSVELANRWKSYEIRWDELRRQSDPKLGLDPTRVQTLSFLWQARDTPYDVWIDDVRFQR